MKQLHNLKPIPLTQVSIKDGFWGERLKTNREQTIPHCLEMLEKVGTIGNFRLAANGMREGFRGFRFADSDLYKTLEAASFSLATHADAVLSDRVENAIDLIGSAQMPDGYVNTFYQVKEGVEKRFTNLRDDHELYCAGHMFEAAVAHFESTGSTKFINIAAKLADLLVATFGENPGQLVGYPGHPETELALVKLAKATKNESFFDLAQFFVEQRGSHYFAREHATPDEKYDGTYWQDDLPIRDHSSIKGHAVRAAYLMCGVLDVASRTEDVALLDMVDLVWRNTVEKRMYVTGGIGSSGANEGFTTDYDLPNLSAYQETCASIAMVFWNRRMANLYGESKYSDLLELALYNAVLAGVSFDGRKFFYANPLASLGDTERQEWFDCACCPPNIARLFASLGGCLYSQSGNELWVNQFVSSSCSVKLKSGKLDFRVETDYPDDELISLIIEKAPEEELSIRLRRPCWSSEAFLEVNGEALEGQESNGYLLVKGTFKANDVIGYRLPMSPRLVVANPKVREDVGKTALARGPLIYCFEGLDQKSEVSGASISLNGDLRHFPSLSGGVKAIEVSGFSTSWGSKLYGDPKPEASAKLLAIPYFAWGNRGLSPMEVWLPAK